MKAEIVATGTELLLGETLNSSAHYLTVKLSSLGIEVDYHTTVGDNPERLEGVLRQALRRCDLLVTTGAVGAALYTWALFVDPWLRVARLPEAVRDAWQPVLAALLCFAFINSLMEGKSFSGDSVQWTILMVVLGVSLRLTAVMRQDSATPQPLTRAAR